MESILLDTAISGLITFASTPQWSSYFAERVAFIKAISNVEENITSHYKEGKMFFNPNDFTFNIGGSIVHEYGHLIFDKMLNKGQAVIANLFKREVASLIEDEDFLTKLHEKYCPDLNWTRFFYDRQYCPSMITDGISILTRKPNQGIHHNIGYPMDFLATELFAECLEAEVLGYKYPIKIYKGECPRTYSYIRGKIYEVFRP